MWNLFDKKKMFFFRSFYLIYPSNKGGDYINKLIQLPWQRNATTVYKLHTSTCFKLKKMIHNYWCTVHTFNKDGRSRHYLQYILSYRGRNDWLAVVLWQDGNVAANGSGDAEVKGDHFIRYLNGYISKPSQNNMNKSTKYFNIFFSFFAFL